MTRKIPEQWVDPKTGKITMEALLYLNDLENNQTDGIVAIGTRLSGVAQKTDGIIAGTQVLATVTTLDAGNIATALGSINANVDGIPSGGITLALSASSASGFGDGFIPVTSNPVTASASGGTGPYTYTLDRVSGDTISYTLSGADNETVTFTGPAGFGLFRTGQYRWTAEDSLGATAAKVFAVTLQSATPGGSLPD